MESSQAPFDRFATTFSHAKMLPIYKIRVRPYVIPAARAHTPFPKAGAESLAAKARSKAVRGKAMSRFETTDEKTGRAPTPDYLLSHRP